MLNLENHPHISAMHVIKNGQMEFEYVRENRGQIYSIGCIFKSFLSVLVGIAIYEGKIGSIEDCVIDYIPYEEIQDVNWYKLKIKHVLSKTTGLVWPKPQEPIPQNMKEVMELKFENEPGASFRYKPDPQIIVYLLEEIYGIEITELFKTKVIACFISKEYEWDRDDIQELSVSIEVLDELGQLLLNKGVVNGMRLFSEEYYEQSIFKYSSGGFPESASYGLSWWLNNDSNIPYFFASGFGGQYLIVVPQENTVISILSDMDRPHPENKDMIRMMLDL